MNATTISAECFHDAHDDCAYEDCACACHHTEDESDLPWADEYDGQPEV